MLVHVFVCSSTEHCRCAVKGAKGDFFFFSREMKGCGNSKWYPAIAFYRVVTDWSVDLAHTANYVLDMLDSARLICLFQRSTPHGFRYGVYAHNMGKSTK